MSVNEESSWGQLEGGRLHTDPTIVLERGKKFSIVFRSIEAGGGDKARFFVFANIYCAFRDNIIN